MALVDQCARLLRDEDTDASAQLRALFDTIERDFGTLLEDEQERAPGCAAPPRVPSVGR